MRIALIVSGAQDVQSAVFKLWELAGPAAKPEDNISLWLADHAASSQSAPLLPEGMEREITLPHQSYTLPEEKLFWLAQICAGQMPDFLVFYGNLSGHELAVRLSARLGCAFFPDTHCLSRQNGTVLATRKTCGSHLDWSCEITGSPTVLTIPAERANQPTYGMQEGCLSPLSAPVRCDTNWMLEQLMLEPRPENPLKGARLLFVGGRGLGSRENCEKLRRTAGAYGAVPGFTRPAAMNGWCGLDEIIGQSGTRTAPEVCVLFGVSGAAAFLAGVSGAKKVIAINTDANAPVFQRADVGVVDDASIILERMAEHAAGGNHHAN